MGRLRKPSSKLCQSVEQKHIKLGVIFHVTRYIISRSRIHFGPTTGFSAEEDVKEHTRHSLSLACLTKHHKRTLPTKDLVSSAVWSTGFKDAPHDNQPYKQVKHEASTLHRWEERKKKKKIQAAGDKREKKEVLGMI